MHRWNGKRSFSGYNFYSVNYPSNNYRHFPKNVWRNHFVRYIWEKIFSCSKCLLNFGIEASKIRSQCLVNSFSFGKPGKNIPRWRYFGRLSKAHRHQNVNSTSSSTINSKAAIPLMPFLVVIFQILFTKGLAISYVDILISNVESTPLENIEIWKQQKFRSKNLLKLTSTTFLTVLNIGIKCWIGD